MPGARKPAVAHERRCVEAVADRPFGRNQLSQVFSRSPPRVLLVPSHNRQGHRHYHAVAWLLAAYGSMYYQFTSRSGFSLILPDRGGPCRWGEGHVSVPALIVGGFISPVRLIRIVPG